MSFSDIFKKSFLQGYSTIELTTKGIIVALCFSLVLGVYIFFCYRFLTRRTFYSKNFNISLVCMSLITTAIILTIQSSVVVSLGMVGALSIVRFRTAIKEPMDLVFLYWAISVGIICGAGLSEIAIILSLVVTIAVLILNVIPLGRAPMILVISAENDKETNKAIRQIVRKYSRFYSEKSRNISGGQLNLVMELSVAGGSDLTAELSSLRTVHSVSLLTHDGEVTF
ncbi:protein of unknown function [Sarcina sp. DSM 11001]|uniref:DUF4956 domain-containing protein n=1 Tax=Sarcina sp. DSM 11001 TaxID=1798184 RepID=UPI00087E9E69|nr:DUF4956 domain-containing protein [Sarcina sp. DSM 11001]SDL62412.1 protein of unknown function [Sarcina sp. DSM 11001]